MNGAGEQQDDRDDMDHGEQEQQLQHGTMDEQHDGTSQMSEDVQLTEGHPAVGAMVPTLPSQKEIAEHELTRIPFRAWCPHCVAARGVEAKHTRTDTDKEKETNTITTVGFDCM